MCFSLKNVPILGIITSSDPPFLYSHYPSFRKYFTGEITKEQWNEYLYQVIEQAIWCRINPSPVFRYQSHKAVNLHIALIGMDQNVSMIDMLEYFNTTLIEQEVNDLVMISDLSVSTLLVQAPESFKEITSEKGESYSLWASKIEHYLKNHASPYWGCDYFVEETNDYNTELNLFIAVIYGRDEMLPWSIDNAGLTHFATNTSELAGMSIITMNYQNLFNNSEGLTLTTLHEIGHLFGLIHPHDYWNPTTSQLEDSWIWGFSSTPMTYLLSDYQFDFFDHLLVWRLQTDSLLSSMNKYDYESKAIENIYFEIREGSFQSLEDELLKVRRVFFRYKDQVNFPILFTRMVMSL